MEKNCKSILISIGWIHALFAFVFFSIILWHNCRLYGLCFEKGLSCRNSRSSLNDCRNHNWHCWLDSQLFLLLDYEEKNNKLFIMSVSASLLKLSCRHRLA